MMETVTILTNIKPDLDPQARYDIEALFFLLMSAERLVGFVNIVKW